MLHLGYLIEQTGNTRGTYLGSGFDLRTDAYGAVRASRGLYVTTHPQPLVGQPLDTGEAQQQIVGAESLLDAMSQASRTHQAGNLDDGYEALKTLTDATGGSAQAAPSGGRTAGGGTGSAKAFKAPVMVFASPSDVALSTQQSVHMASHRQINLVSGRSTHVAIGKSLVAGVADRISLFVQNAGAKLFAAKGKIEVRAHSDNVELTAQKTAKIVSATGNIEVAARQEILLTSGGAYIRIKDGNIEIHAPGKIDIKGAQHSFAGPAQLSYSLPLLPVAATPRMFSQRFDAKPLLGHQFNLPYRQVPYIVRDASGKLVGAGTLDENGFTDRIFTAEQSKLKVYIGDDPWRVFVDSRHSA